MTMIMTDEERQALAKAVVREVVREVVVKPLVAKIASAFLGNQGAPEIDYEALITACYERTRYAQGSKGCVAFKEGAEWFREQVLAAAPVAHQAEQGVTITQAEYDALQHFKRIYSQISSILACIAETEPVKPGDEITVQRLKWVILEHPRLLASVAQQAEPCRPDILERLTYHALERDDLTLDDCLSYLAKGWYEVHGRTERQMVMQILALLAATPEQPAPVPLTPIECVPPKDMASINWRLAYKQGWKDAERAHGITKGDAS